MKKIFIIVIVLLPCFCTKAQQINIRKYNIENGLVNNDILSIYQDSRGFIWLCTRGGLSRYDGSRFYNYTTQNGLTNDMINDVYEITTQQFIVAQNSDGPRLLKNGVAQAFLPNTGLIVNNFHNAGNKKLIATTDYNGIVVWDSSRFKKLNTAYKEIISNIAIVNDSVWMILQENVFIQFITPSLKPLSPRLPLNTTTVFTDSHHRTWVGTVRGLLLVNTAASPGKPISFLPLPPMFNLPLLKEAYIAKMMEDSRGNCWICTNKGLVKISANGNITILTEQDGLPSSIINCMLEDRENNIWVGTPLGLAKFSPGSEMKKVAIKLNLSPDNSLYISPGQENNVRLFDGRGIHHLNLATGKLSNALPANAAGYRMYRLNKQQILIIQGKEEIIYHTGDNHEKHIAITDFTNRRFNTITTDNKGNLFGVYFNQLFHISNNSSEKKLTLNVVDQIYDLMFDKQNFLWAGTQNHGLFKIKTGSSNDSLTLTTIDTFVQRLPDPHIRTLYTDTENELWIGTRYKGVVRLLELPNGSITIQNYGTREGLSSDFVLTINRDPAGNIWVGTVQGVDKLVPSGNGYRVFSFGKVNRFFSHVYDIFFLKDYYLFSSDYPNVMYARDMQQDTLPPPAVYITGINYSMRDTIVTDAEQQTRLPYNKAQIYFEFSAPQFINEDFTTYSYRLLGGGDTNWSVSGKSHSVYFANLRPGNYAFQVKALGFDGKWGVASAYSFIVNTPFWQQTWFILLIIATVGMVIYALYRYRVQQLIRLQKVRNRIATDLHDEIGSNLTNISILSSLSKKNLSEPQRANDFLQRISEEVSSSSQALDDIIWSVNTNHDTLEETVARMRRYAAELFDAANINYELHLDTAFEEKKISMEQRRDVYLLYKEAMNNISKHANAKHVSIQIAIEHNHLVLYIKDDGKGFNMSNEYSRHGLKGMKERVKKWKGNIVIESAEQKGTFIQIRMPASK